MKWLVLVLGIFANTLASILVKLSVTPPREVPSIGNPLAAITNWPLWFGLLLYMLTFLLYILALARFPLSVAHPILTSGAVVSVALVSVLLFREPFHWTLWLGVLLVIVGVALITSRVS